MFSRTIMGFMVLIGLNVGAAQAATNTNVPAPAHVATAPAADDNSTDSANAPAPEQDDSNPYSGIVRANVFHLTDPPQIKPKEDPAILNLPKVNITGFRKREGEPIRALFATVPKDPKEPAKYFNLSEGEKEDILEVKKIDPSQESVDVIIAGTPTTLTVKSNSFVQPIVVPKIGAPGMPMPNPLVARPPVAAIPVQPPIAQAAAPGAPAPNASPYGNVIVAGGSTTPAPVTPAVGGNPPPTYPNGYNPNGAAVGGGQPVSTGQDAGALRSIPTRGIRTPNYQPGGAPPPPAFPQ